MNCKNIMLLGLQRSGTTLACHLLNKLPNTVALHEPLVPIEFKDDARLEIIERINTFCNNQRISLLSSGLATSKTNKGKVPDNHMGNIDKKTGKRVDIIDSKILKTNKNLPNDFTLIIKHCAFFTGILDTLINSYQCFAIIRNPLSTLLSWNSLEFEVSNGHAPAAERFDDSLKQILEIESNKYQRQILLLTWYYNKIHQYLPKENIIFYEDIISSGGSILKKITPEAAFLKENLHSKNKNPIYSSSLKPILAKKLLKLENDGYLNFYSKSSIKEIAKDISTFS